jgi:hypothetical protein
VGNEVPLKTEKFLRGLLFVSTASGNDARAGSLMIVVAGFFISNYI